MLYDKRFNVFHYPVTDEDAPNYHSIIQTPMDIATILQRVDCGQYLSRASFLRDVDLIVANAKVFFNQQKVYYPCICSGCPVQSVHLISSKDVIVAEMMPMLIMGFPFLTS